MTWPQIREHLRRELTTAKQSRRLVQTDIAARMGKHQSAVSKLLTYPYKHGGPTIETLIDALDALNIPVSEFFRRIEQGLPAGEPARQLMKPTAAAQAIITHLRGIISALERSWPK